MEFGFDTLRCRVVLEMEVQMRSRQMDRNDRNLWWTWGWGVRAENINLGVIILKVTFLAKGQMRSPRPTEG